MKLALVIPGVRASPRDLFIPAFSNLAPTGENKTNYLQSNPYPATGQNDVCGAGNEVTKGKNVNTGSRLLPQSVTTTQPPGVKSGKTTEDTESVGTDNIRTK